MTEIFISIQHMVAAIAYVIAFIPTNQEWTLHYKHLNLTEG